MILTISLNPAIDKIYFVNDYTLGEVHRPERTIASVGGKGLNVAKVATILGQKVGVTGFLGGSNGDFLRKGVTHLGMIDAFMEIEGETRICINVSDKAAGTSTEVLEEGPVITVDEAERFLVDLEEIIKPYEVVAMSGSLARGLAADYYARIIALCKAQDKKVLLDTSGAALVEGIKEKPYLMKPNKDEISHIYKNPINDLADATEAIRHLMSLGVTLPLYSMGKDGCLAGIEGKCYHFTLPPVEVVNTVGSGDSFIAGCAVGLDRGLSLIDTVKLAVGCGTANTQFEETGKVSLELVAQYVAAVEVKELV